MPGPTTLYFHLPCYFYDVNSGRSSGEAVHSRGKLSSLDGYHALHPVDKALVTRLDWRHRAHTPTLTHSHSTLCYDSRASLHSHVSRACCCLYVVRVSGCWELSSGRAVLDVGSSRERERQWYRTEYDGRFDRYDEAVTRYWDEQALAKHEQSMRKQQQQQRREEERGTAADKETERRAQAKEKATQKGTRKNASEDEAGSGSESDQPARKRLSKPRKKGKSKKRGGSSGAAGSEHESEAQQQQQQQQAVGEEAGHGGSGGGRGSSSSSSSSVAGEVGDGGWMDRGDKRRMTCPFAGSGSGGDQWRADDREGGTDKRVVQSRNS